MHATLGTAGTWLDSGPYALGALGDLGNLAFFALINDFLRDEIDVFRERLLGNTIAWVGAIALTLMTFWILVQGYRIVTGQSRDSMMALVTNSLRSVLVIGMATGLAVGGTNIYDFLTDVVSSEITQVVTGDDDDPYENIDKSLLIMQASMSTIDALETSKNPKMEEEKERAMLFTGIGIAGPAIVAGAMLLLNKVAMALFIGLGPIFVMSLLFEQTKSLFSRWLYYGVGTMFSLAILSVMAALAMKMVAAVAAAFLVRYMATDFGLNAEGINSMALQQGGLGLILTTLIIMAPPMAAAFFQGTLGHFSSYSQFGNAGRPMVDASGRQVGHTYIAQPVQATKPSSSYTQGSSRPTQDCNPATTGSFTGSYAAHADEIKTSQVGFGRS